MRNQNAYDNKIFIKLMSLTNLILILILLVSRLKFLFRQKDIKPQKVINNVG